MDNIPVPDEVFNRAYEAVLEAAHRMEQSGGKHPAYFEFLFGMAMFIFKEQKAEYIVLETGMGGRLDSTNIIKKPLMTVITSVSMDHMHVLGNTIEEIAGEKAGIIKPGVPLVFYGGDERVRGVLEKTALERKTPYEIIDDTKGNTLVAASTQEKDVMAQIKDTDKKGAAKIVGKLIAERASEAGIKQVVFDRGGYVYTGRVAELAAGAREAGLEF